MQQSISTKYLAIALAAAASASARAQGPALQNATLARYGARIEVAASAGARRDPSTSPQSSFDGNAHTRQVMTGAPYTFTIRLREKLPIDRIDFAHSDYVKELAPRDIEIRLDGGEPIKASLELKRPQKRKPDWQQVLVGRQAQVITITVLSNHQAEGAVGWGGLGEIAVWTSADLEAGLVIPGYDAKAPAFVHAPAQKATAANAAKLPPRAAPGQHPCLLLTPAEVPVLRASLAASERGRAALETLLKVADGTLNGAVAFPDPKGPQGQLKDRGDDVAKSHSRLSLNCGTLGMAYTLSGDAKYARRAREILLGYAERYEQYPEHKGANKNDTGKVMAQRLSEAMWLIPLIESFDAIQAGDTLSDADRKQIETGLIRPALTFIRRKEPAQEAAARQKTNPNWRSEAWGKAASNWLIFYNSATMMAGATLQDRDLMDLAASDLRALIDHGVSDDGMWGEGAIGYQFFAISALVPALESAARQGIDLWSWNSNRVKKLFESPLRYAYPDGTAPGINDSSRAKLGNWSTMSYDYGWLRFGDPAFAALVNQSPRQLMMSEAVYFPTRVYEDLPAPPASAFSSTLFADLGYAILRGPQTYALMDYGPHGGVHGHRDKLNLILFAQGDDNKSDELGGEPVFHRYEDALHDAWTTQSIAHNTMSVDGRSQAATTGRLLAFEDTPGLKVMRAQSDSAYPGVLLDRTVVVLGDLVLDVFLGRSAQPHDWHRTFRFQGTLDGMPAASTAIKPLGDVDGFEQLQVLGWALRPLKAQEMWRGSWRTSVGGFDVTLAGMPGQNVALAAGPDKEHVAIAHQEGDQAEFTAAYAMQAWQNPVRSLRRMLSPPEVSAFECRQQDGTVAEVFVSHQPGTWEAGPWAGEIWKSDARVLVVRRRAGQAGQTGQQSVLLCGGTFAQSGADSVKLPAPGNALAEGAAEAGSTLKIASSWVAGAPNR